MLRSTVKTEEETTPVPSAPVITTPVVSARETVTIHNAPGKSERRYRPETVEKAVALAARMQTEHQETLSAEEIETIAAEAGIQPEFVRRALALVEAKEDVQEESHAPVVVRRYDQKMTRRRLSRRKKLLMFGIPALYAAVTFPLMFAASHWNVTRHYGNGELGPYVLMTLSMILPSLLAVILGISLPRKRQGAIAGYTTGLFTFLSLFVSLTLTLPYRGDLGEIFYVVAFFLAVGTALGSLGTALRQSLPYLHDCLSNAIATLSPDEDDEPDAVKRR